MIESMDASVGALIEALKANGLEDNTLVVFTSDNGGYLNYGSLFSNISSNGQFRGQKVDLYEGGHRVPFIASWPGRIPAGSVTRETAHSNDLALTFARIADIDLATQVFDGVDLAPVIFEEKELPARSLYWRSRSHRAVRSGPWKLVAERNGGQSKLYHLDKDPGETTDLSSQHPDRVRELDLAWDKWNATMEKSASEHYAPATPSKQ